LAAWKVVVVDPGTTAPWRAVGIASAILALAVSGCGGLSLGGLTG